MIETRNVYINKLIAVTSAYSDLSFAKLYEHLRTIDVGSIGQSMSQLVQQRIAEIEKEKGELSVDNAQDFLEAFELIFGWANNLATDTPQAWGMSTPIPSVLFAGTVPMYDLLEQTLSPVIDQRAHLFCRDVIHTDKIMYELVLDRLYGIPMTATPYIFEYIGEEEVTKYLKLEVDFSFVTVRPKTVLPTLDFSCVNNREMLDEANVQPLLQSIHLDNFIFEGFSMLRFTDATESFVLDSIQDMILNFNTYTRNEFVHSLLDKIKSVLGKQDVNCSLFPVLYLNGMPILKEGVAKSYLLFNEYIGGNIDNIEEYVLRYLESPFILSYNIHPDFDTKLEYFRAKIEALDVSSYVCFPLKHQEELVGFLELYTKEESTLSPSILTRLSPLFPVLIQLGYDLRLKFKNRLDTVILQNYTALQPAVQWRFNQAAAKYLKDYENTHESLPLERISFSNVYPLYGGVDIKDSTKLRNIAFRKDNKLHLDRLRSLMKYLPEGLFPDLAALKSFKRKMDKVDTWLATDRKVERMHDITAFFQEEVATFILTLSWLDDELDRQIKIYAESLGITYYQDAFEESLKQVNTLIAGNINKLNEFVQERFPSYFEKFRTDGIEYDFYIGQSITPSMVFNPTILRTFRRQQLVSMAQISQQVDRLQDSLPIAMNTTQLIFVHPTAIDISFRRDERRFDVEGGYNIRYQMIKKRIDKVLIRGTDERLVQPGKIAVVVQGEAEVSILIEDLLSVADMGLIKPDIEELELEELQGVSGLHALRVDVIL
ncbi:GAF domain-containing protein [Sphingobacterium paucimobilis]|uniref:GAF domain-containing protein n=1 Tax=Sphingobacterium paucimobilis HER1398 TaxID=1346330 RepID=U2HQU2_9SPHI|nr:GAF domain-containing protein [Sphingobacterium paucimobilis]ERJ57650.1 hypothetical protein M472_02605 [Sphingobacterium paucimobilis HER1398]